MAYLKKYRINFRELERGVHHFTFEIGNHFFDCFEKSEVRDGTLRAQIELTKEEGHMLLKVAIDGDVSVVCDRCLESFLYPIQFNGSLCVKTEEEKPDKQDEVMWIDPGDSFIPLSQYFYESIHLALPIKRTHLNDGSTENSCNSEMLKLIKNHQKKDGKNTPDPRWEKLRQLQEKHN